jgi:hypothetical protein
MPLIHYWEPDAPQIEFSPVQHDPALKILNTLFFQSANIERPSPLSRRQAICTASFPLG